MYNKINKITLVLVVAAAAYAQDAPPAAGTLKVGEVSLTRSTGKFSAGPLGTIDILQDGAGAAFSSIDLSKVVQSDQQRDVTIIDPCTISKLGQPSNGNNPNDSVTYLDAGPALNLTGPKGSKQVPVVSKMLYGAMLGGGTPIPGLPAPPAPYLEPGVYTVDNGAGGADVGPFTGTLTLPDQFVWSNADSVSPIDRSAGVDIAWTGGDPSTKVYIGGSVTITDPATRRVSGGATFSCIADNSAGHFLVPPEVLTLLPATTTSNGVPNGNMIVTNGVQADLALPGFDQSLFIFNIGIARTVAMN